MRQRSELPLPERCSLYQALLWVSDSVRPIEDWHFVALPHPETLGPTDEHKQKLLQALMLGHLKANGTYWCDDFLGNDARNDQTLDLKPRVWKEGDVDWQKSSLRLTKPFGDTDVYDLITVPTIKLMEIFPDPSEPAPVSMDTARTNSEQTKPEPEKSAVVGPLGSAAPKKRGVPGRPNLGVPAAKVYLETFPKGHEHLGHSWKSAITEIANHGAPDVSVRTLKRALETLRQRQN